MLFLHKNINKSPDISYDTKFYVLKIIIVIFAHKVLCRLFASKIKATKNNIYSIETEITIKKKIPFDRNKVSILL